MLDAAPSFALLALGVAVALAYLPMANRPPSAARSLLKTLPLLCFAAASYAGNAPPLLTVALFFSALGDFALSRPGRAAFLYGLAAFALAHLTYILLFLAQNQASLWEAFVSQPLPAVALLALALSTEVWLQPHAGGLKWPVRAYVVLITGMGLAALTHGPAIKLIRASGEVFASPPPSALLIAGAGLFILSDFILALRMFRMANGNRHARATSIAVWVSYIAGQFLIAISLSP